VHVRHSTIRRLNPTPSLLVSSEMEVTCSACLPLHSGLQDDTVFLSLQSYSTTEVSSSQIILTIGWHAPKFSALGVHPSGFASKSSLGELHISFDPPADYGMIAEAAGAWSKQVKEIGELESALKEAVKKVQGGQSALLNVFVKN
jgi:hypothetical protein